MKEPAEQTVPNQLNTKLLVHAALDILRGPFAGAGPIFCFESAHLTSWDGRATHPKTSSASLFDQFIITAVKRRSQKPSEEQIICAAFLILQ